MKVTMPSTETMELMVVEGTPEETVSEGPRTLAQLQAVADEARTEANNRGDIPTITLQRGEYIALLKIGQIEFRLPLFRTASTQPYPVFRDCVVEIED